MATVSKKEKGSGAFTNVFAYFAINRVILGLHTCGGARLYSDTLMKNDVGFDNSGS